MPAINATLNCASAILLLAGYVCIKNQKRTAHAACMISALVTSSLFLISYLTYHFVYHGLTRFAGPHAAKMVYLTILLTHTILAAVIVPLIILTVLRAARRDFVRHKRIARWTFPLWLYVSITGVVIYVMLYVMYPHTS
jgi:uncharacterized membrane protein YozB (DUF420 family)